MSKRVFIANSSPAYAALFMSIGFTPVEHKEEADLIVFTGGADVTPALYGHEKHPRTFNSFQRDEYESEVFHFAKAKNIPMVGICRGGQFLNCMSGGTMYQDVGRHCGSHEITDLTTGEKVFVSSTHHQMMKPSPEAVLVASSHLNGFREWFDYGVWKRDVSDEDVEVVFYEKTKSLCFQPHPEFTGEAYNGMTRYFESLLNRFFFDKAA